MTNIRAVLHVRVAIRLCNAGEGVVPAAAPLALLAHLRGVEALMFVIVPVAILVHGPVDAVDLAASISRVERILSTKASARGRVWYSQKRLLRSARHIGVCLM